MGVDLWCVPSPPVTGTLSTKSWVVSLNSTVGQAHLLVAGSPGTTGPGSNPCWLLGSLLLCAANFCLGGALDLAAATLAVFVAVAALVGESKTSTAGLVAGIAA